MFAMQMSFTGHLDLAMTIIAVVAPPLIAVWARHRWRFSLRTMLVATVIFCLAALFVGQDFRPREPIESVFGSFPGDPDPLSTQLRSIKNDPIFWVKAHLELPALCLIGSTIVTAVVLKMLGRRDR